MSNHYLESLLGEREEILLITRQHWFVFLRSILFELLISALIIIAILLIGTFLQFPAVFFGFLLLLIPIGGLVQDYLFWINKMYIITNRRVMQIAGIFNKNVIDSSLEKVNDVKMNQSFLGRIFNFGDIEILTASELGVNLFKKIGNPIEFKTTMLNAKENLDIDDDRLIRRASSENKDDVPELILELDHLRKSGVITEEEFAEKKNQLLAKL
jgi:uncharacterized membrane protein YdbT with pleckstrin-like domain